MLDPSPPTAVQAVRAVDAAIAASTSALRPPASPFAHLSQRVSSNTLSLFARQAASSSSEALLANESSSQGTDRRVVQSELRTMSLDQLLNFNNTSGITITAIIAVVSVLAGVFIICILLAAILSKTNAPRHEAFPYAQQTGQPAMYQPSASVPQNNISNLPPLVDQDLKANLLDSAAPFAGDSASHNRTGSSGVGFPGPAFAARRGLTAAQYQDRSPGMSALGPSDAFPFPAPSGTVNYNGRDMTINMAGPQADAAVRQAAEMRLESERARRSTVIGGPPPLTDGKRASRYSRASMTPGSRLSVAAKKAQRMSRQRLSRLSTFSSAEPFENGGGNLSAHRGTVTSTGAGMVRNNRWNGDDEVYTGRRSTARRSAYGGPRASRLSFRPPPPAGGRRPTHSYYDADQNSMISATDSVSVYDTPSMYHVNDLPEWSAAPASQSNLLDPLHTLGPNPFVVASR